MDQYNGGNGGGYPPQGGNVPPRNGYMPQGGYIPPQGGYVPPQGEYAPPQQDYAPPQTAYMPPQAPPKKNLWVWVGGGAVLVIVLVLVLALTLGGGGGTLEKPASPMLYMEDGDIYLAAGAQGILLDGAEFASGHENEYLDAYMSVDGKYLFYLADANSSGEGDLMRIALNNAKAEPERVAADVYSARISADGKKILFITDVDDAEGDLYLCSLGGKPEKIEDSVQTGGFGFSPNAAYIYYQMNSGDDAESLMIFKGGKSTAVEEVENSWFSDIFLDDKGRMVFDAYSYNDSEYTLYVYADGNTERVSKDAYLLTSMASGAEFIYVTGDDDMIYYNNGEETQVGEDWARINFPSWPGRDPRLEREAHFVFSEGTDSSKTLYEVKAPGDPVKIGKYDTDFIVDSSFRYAVYESDDTLYLSRKEGSGWSRREEICDNPSQYDIDDDSRYLYYIACDDGEYTGDLCRIPLKGGEEEVLMEDVRSFLLWQGSVYAQTDDDDAYIVKNAKSSERIERDITDFQTANDGIYLIGDGGELYFFNGKETERISRDATVIEDYGLIVATVD